MNVVRSTVRVVNRFDYVSVVFCFFKQKTAYEMLRSLVGSEMCIRDSLPSTRVVAISPMVTGMTPVFRRNTLAIASEYSICLLYTSDAADDLLCVDLGGRRINKKKISKHYPIAAPTHPYILTTQHT